jgi:hypothetical protein
MSRPTGTYSCPRPFDTTRRQHDMSRTTPRYSISLRPGGNAMPRHSGENSFGDRESVTSRHSGEAQSNRGGHKRGGMSQKRDHSKTGETTDELFSDDRSYQTADTVNSRLFGNGTQGRRRRPRREPASLFGNGTQGSRRTRSRLEPWNRPLQIRRQFNVNLTWNGNRARFHEYRDAIMAHLLQIGAGYLLHTDFLAEYEIHRTNNQHMEYLTSEAFWSKHGVPFAQAKYDRQYLYAILLSMTRKILNKVILANKKDLDGILAWIQMRRNYDYGGSIQLRVDAIDVEVRKPYFNSSPGGLSAYIERHETLMAELNDIAPKEYTDDRKQRLLLKNVRRAPGMAHLTFHCEVQNLSYDMSADFLLEKALILEHDIATHDAPKRIMKTVSESVEEPGWLTIDAITQLFGEVARESSLFTAYQAFNSRLIRQAMRIPDNIWHFLEPAYKDKINDIRKTRGERQAKAAQSEHRLTTVDETTLLFDFDGDEDTDDRLLARPMYAVDTSNGHFRQR